MYCAERERLVARYETATREYSITVQSLSGKRTREFAVAFQDTERLRVACNEARDALDRHSIQHGCGKPSGSIGD